MTHETFADQLASHSNPIDMLRSNYGRHPYPVPSEFTNWIDEVKSWRDTASLSDLSHHQKDLYVSGPDSLQPFVDAGINDFSGFEPGKAKQFVACNSEGYLIGDAILFYLDENRLKLTGTPIAPNWIEYTIDQGQYDVAVDADERYWDKDEPHQTFRYQLQGPNAVPIMEAAADNSVPDLPFFHLGEFSINGVEVRALRHSMVAEPGYEFWGPWDERETVKNRILEVDEDYGLRQLGEKSYKAQGVEKGWIPRPLPAIFGPEFADYRDWLPADTYEASSALGGSYNPESIEQYYLNPIELGYERFIDWDREFVGRTALKERAANPQREKVTLVWDPDDVLRLFGSLFEDQQPYKWLDLSQPYWSVFHYDTVRQNDDVVGVSTYFGYSYNEREMLSLALVDADVVQSGQDVTIRWGEPDGTSTNPKVEDHRPVDIDATVEGIPYPLEKNGRTGAS